MAHLQYGPVYASTDYAGFFRRTAALLFDVLLLILLLFVLLFAAALHTGEEELPSKTAVFCTAATLVCWVVYMLGMRMLERGTLGYRLMRIRYQSVVDGRPPLLARAYRSTLAFVFMFAFLALFLDHLWILFDERKQAWHDKMSGFYVIRKKARPIGSTPVQQRVINFMGLTLFVWEPLESTLNPTGEESRAQRCPSAGS